MEFNPVTKNQNKESEIEIDHNGSEIDNLFNKESFDVLTIGPFSGKSFEEVFEMSLDALLRAGSQISISPSTGGRGGWNITLGPLTNDGDE